LAFHVGSTLVAAYREFGIDLNELSRSGWPASRARDLRRANGRFVEYAFVEPDFRLRAEPRMSCGSSPH